MKNDVLTYLKDYKIINIYHYGSHVYGTNNDQSDYDFIAIVEDDIKRFEIRTDKYDLSIYSEKEFLLMSNICFYECLYLDPKYILYETKTYPKLIKDDIRHIVSKQASNSYVKAKKKLMLHADLNTSIKSLFHSFRIIEYGIDLVTTDTIDYVGSAALHKDILLETNMDWNYYQNKYKTAYNSLLTVFRKVAKK